MQNKAFTPQEQYEVAQSEKQYYDNNVFPEQQAQADEARQSQNMTAQYRTDVQPTAEAPKPATPNANVQKQEQLSVRPKPTPSQSQQTQQTQSQQAQDEVIPATLVIPATVKAQSDWNAVGKYMYLPNHPKAVNGYVQLSKGDVIWARQKLNLPTEQPEATAPVTQTAPQTTTATQPKDAVDKQAVGVPLDQRGELLKQYQKAMRNAKKIKAQYISKAKQYFRDVEQIKADAEGNKEYRMNEAYSKWSADKRALNADYQKAMQVASQYYEQLRK